MTAQPWERDCCAVSPPLSKGDNTFRIGYLCVY